MKTLEKEIQKGQRILEETIGLLKEKLEREVLDYDEKGYKTRFFTKGKRSKKGVRVNIPEEWIEDSSPSDNNIRDELKIFLKSLEGRQKHSHF